jgi:membrane associated rhomboid family serine protease
VLIPINVDVPMQRWPYANWALIGLTCILAVVYLSDPASGEGVFVLWSGGDFEPVQLIGSLFGHGDPLHLIGNMAFLFVFGNAIDAKLGHLPFLALYFGLGVLESLVWLALGDGSPTLGASGAIMGIVGVFLVLYPRNDVTCFYYFGPVFTGTFSVSSYWIILMYIAFDVVGLALAGESGVNHLAHFAGAASGFAIAASLNAAGVIKSADGEETIIDLYRARHSPAPDPVRRAARSAPSAPPPPVPRSRPLDLGPIPLAGDEPPRPRSAPRPAPSSPPRQRPAS